MNVRKIVLGVAIVGICYGFTRGLNQFQYIFNRLEVYVDMEAPEKIYLHTDKQYYTNGETIWFKSYLVNGITHAKSSKSKVSYIELINPADSVVARRTVYTNNIGVNGDILIDKNWPTGTYILRSYTNYMRNAKNPVFFQKEIPIWKQKITDEEIYTSSSSTKTSDSLLLKNMLRSPSKSLLPKIKFYAEGGHFIAGMDNTLGIHVTDNAGNGIPLLGSIKDESGQKITLFRSYKFGLGKVQIRPQVGKKYVASITINGEEKTYPLPEVQETGYRLGVRNTKDHIIIDVESSTKNGLYNSLLIGHLRGKTFFKHIEPKGTNSYSLKLLISELDDGVSHFTLFTAAGEVVCERLVFIDNPENDVALNIKTNKTAFANRDRVVVDVTATDTKGALLKGDFSMTVISTDSLEKRSETSDIRSWLLLDSDLKGTIENPGYFFEDEGKRNKKFLLDALMLTHGWRRFVWKDFLGNEKPRKELFPAEKGIFIKGKTTIFNKPFATKQSEASVTFLEKGIYQDKKITDPNGRFSFGPFVFKDSISTVIEAVFPEEKNERKRKDISIFIDGPLPSPTIERFERKQNLPLNKEYILQYLSESRRQKVTDFKYNPDANQLDEVILSVKKKSKAEKLAEQYGDSPNRLIIDSVLGASSKSVIDILREMPAVNISGTFPDVNIAITGGGVGLGAPAQIPEPDDSPGASPVDTSLFIQNGPLIVIDGVELSLDFIVGMSASEVLFIDIIRANEAVEYGARGSQGVVSIYTRRGTDFIRNQKQSPGITNFQIPGFYQAREFFSPDYSRKKPEDLFPDYRTTLHWEPHVLVTAEKSTKVDFYTSDNKGRYLIKIEGITDDGRVVKSIEEIQIE